MLQEHFNTHKAQQLPVAHLGDGKVGGGESRGTGGADGLLQKQKICMPCASTAPSATMQHAGRATSSHAY